MPWTPRAIHWHILQSIIRFDTVAYVNGWRFEECLSFSFPSPFWWAAKQCCLGLNAFLSFEQLLLSAEHTYRQTCARKQTSIMETETTNKQNERRRRKKKLPKKFLHFPSECVIRPHSTSSSIVCQFWWLALRFKRIRFRWNTFVVTLPHSNW